MKRAAALFIVVVFISSAVPALAADWSRELRLTTTAGQRTVTLRTFWGEALNIGTPFVPIRLGPSGPVALPAGTFGPSGSVTDTVPNGDPFACYAIAVPVRGRTSDLGCFLPGSATGKAPPTASLLTCSVPTDACNQSPPKVTFSWTAPQGDFTGYTVLVFSNGSAQAHPLPKTQTGLSQPFTSSVCYVVFVVNDIIPVGQSDLMCAFPVPAQG